MHAFAVSLLLAISALLGVRSIPGDLGNWRVTQAWAADGDYMRLMAESTELPKLCAARPDDQVVFPAIIHGAHVVSLDGRPLLRFGDPTFETMRSFYGQPLLSCREVMAGSVLQWTASSYTQYFARINYMPTISSVMPLYNVFAETFHIIGAGVGLIMAVFTFVVFAGKVSRQTTLAVCSSAFFSSFYLGGCVAGFMGLPWSMLTAHKIADIGVWFAICSLVKALWHEKLVSRAVFLAYAGACALAIVIILLGRTGDEVQFGTTIPFGLTLAVLTVPMLRLGRELVSRDRSMTMLFQFLALGSFVLAVFNEMFAVTGLIHSSPMLPFGFMGGIMFLGLSVNVRVNEAYAERDYLRDNLELEVKRKTQQLEKTMADLKLTQAELVQSAKLASLGTLSAGIAHEINNSLNYVNGALLPLERLIEKSATGPEREKVSKLVGVMKEGLGLTLEIIKSLRTYTGLNQAKFNDVNLSNVVGSALAILRSKIRGRIEVLNEIEPSLSVYGSVVGLNQVFMNLISNAIDAMPEGGKLLVTGNARDGIATLSIQDTGAGIPPEIVERIFEPFFTTKDVGSGTGLGLHIVKQEIERHQGSIRVETQPGVGTKFHLTLPLTASLTEAA